MGETFRFKKRKGLRCNYCGEEKPDGYDKPIYDSRFMHHFELSDDKKALWWKHESGWYEIEIKKRKLIKKNRSWHTRLYWYCLDCGELPRREMKEITEDLFVTGKVVQFKRGEERQSYYLA